MSEVFRAVIWVLYHLTFFSPLGPSILYIFKLLSPSPQPHTDIVLGLFLKSFLCNLPFLLHLLWGDDPLRSPWLEGPRGQPYEQDSPRGFSKCSGLLIEQHPCVKRQSEELK